MLRSHHVAYKFDEEVEIKKSLLADNKGRYEQPVFGKLILFMTLFEVSTTCAPFAQKFQIFLSIIFV